jgi:HTH-type transcriptional regulator/antitoxin HigA
MQTLDLNQTQQNWLNLTDTLFVAHTEEQYNKLVKCFDKLIDEVGENESHPLASLMEIIGILIEQYENNHVPEL